MNILNLDADFLIELDIMKNERRGRVSDIPGCYVSNEKGALKWHVTAKNTGPIYLR